VHFRADERCDLVDFDLAFGQEIWEGGVCILAVVVVLEELQRRVSRGPLAVETICGAVGMYLPLGLIVPHRKIVRIGSWGQLVCSLDLALLFVFVSNQVLLVMTSIGLQWRRNGWSPEGNGLCQAGSHVVYF
jgi:hypothetical protein